MKFLHLLVVVFKDVLDAVLVNLRNLDVEVFNLEVVGVVKLVKLLLVAWSEVYRGVAISCFLVELL